MQKIRVLTETGYAKLITDIRRIIEEGRVRAAKAASLELAVTYWQVGERICREGLTERGGYGDSILEDLAEELDSDASTLLRCIHFFQTYKSIPRNKNLTWSHYKYLLALSDAQERRWYEQLVNQEGLTVPQLATAIKRGRFLESQAQKGKQVKSKMLKRPKEATYVYTALVERVIDGDTLILRIDLGFQVWKEQRVRLAGIDTPAIDEPKGREAYEYARDQMAKVPYVMVKTNKIDIYGRYVGHIFYLLKDEDKDKIFAQGRYLNQELVDRRLARLI